MLARALGWALFAWVFNGLQIWPLVLVHSGMSLLLSVGGYAFAWSVGFLVVFAPGGLGVREVVLVTMLTRGRRGHRHRRGPGVPRGDHRQRPDLRRGERRRPAKLRTSRDPPLAPPASEAQHDGQGPLRHESLMTTDRKQSGREQAR